MKSNAPAISIVLPVYNAAESLPACIGSVQAQTLADWELICVDDGSTDASPQVLAAYAAQDERMRVITQENRGVSAARNAGIEAVRAHVMMFIDADDAYLPQACAAVAERFAQDPQLEALVFGAQCVPEEDAPKHVRDLLSPADQLFERNAAGAVDPALFFGAHAQPYAWRAAFSRELVAREGLRFEPGLKLAEDAAFQILAYSVARRTRLVSQKLYRYAMQGASATHAYNAEASRQEKMEQHLVAINAIFSGWKRRGIAGFYLRPAITWAMDLLLFDIVRVDEAQALGVASRLAGIFSETYGSDWLQYFKDAGAQGHARHSPDRAVLRVARAIDRAPSTRHFQLGPIDLVRFFVATRGVKQCVERFI